VTIGAGPVAKQQQVRGEHIERTDPADRGDEHVDHGFI
jgi:hypothetical protein